MPTLDIRQLAVRYASKRGTVDALSNVNLTMRDGDFVVAIGASGCGKTTLLSCIAGFLPPTDGEILLDGVVNLGELLEAEAYGIVGGRSLRASSAHHHTGNRDESYR